MNCLGVEQERLPYSTTNYGWRPSVQVGKQPLATTASHTSTTAEEGSYLSHPNCSSSPPYLLATRQAGLTRA